MTDNPRRIQRLRTKGGMPEGAVYVGAGSKWGNPFPLDQPCHADVLLELANDVVRR